MNRIKSRTGEYPVKKRLAVRTVLALVLVLAFPGGITAVSYTHLTLPTIA